MTELFGGPRLFEKLAAERCLEALARHDQLVRELLGDFGGLEVEKSHRFLLLFDRPLDAVAYCLAYHEAVAELPLEIDPPLRGRAGIHLGEVFLWENPPEHVARGAKPLEVEGPARTVVARVLSLAGAGQTLLSQGAFELARRGAVGAESLPEKIEWLSHGLYRFGPDDPGIDIHEVGLAGTAPLTAPLSEELSGEGRRTAVAGDRAWRPEAGQAVPDRPQWLLDRRLDDATFGELWLATHQKTGDHHALRFCDAGERPRLIRQLAVVRHLRESLGAAGFLVRHLDSHLEEQPFFIEAEYEDARSLPEWAADQGGLPRVPLATRIGLVALLAEALAEVHSSGLALGDLQPRGLLIIDHVEAPPGLKLADLSVCESRDPGLARELAAAPADAAGPEPYRAPELADSGRATRAADAYALGVILFQMVAGDLDRRPGPFWQRDVADGPLRDLLARSLDPDPRNRLKDMAELAASLRA